MAKPRIMLLVDVLLALSVVTLAGLGLMLHFVLPAGAGSSGPVTLTWLGLLRSQWEVVYFSGTLVTLALAAAHILLHRAGYVRLYEEAVPNATLRTILAPLGGVAALFLLCLPLLARPELKGGEGVKDLPANLPAASPAAQPGSPPPAPLADTQRAELPKVQPSLPAAATRSASPPASRVQKKLRTRRPASYRATYRPPVRYGLRVKGKPRNCPGVPFRRYILAVKKS